MTRLSREQLLIAAEKFQKTYVLLKASVDKTTDFDAEKKIYC